MRMIILVLLATCIVGNFATIFELQSADEDDVTPGDFREEIRKIRRTFARKRTAQGYKNKVEFQNMQKLSSKMNVRQPSKGSIGNENLMQIM